MVKVGVAGGVVSKAYLLKEPITKVCLIESQFIDVCVCACVCVCVCV